MDLDDEELKATRMMNGADRKGRVNKMEQDIKILEELKNIFLSLKYHGYINDVKKDISTDGVINAIENILKERQQDKEKIKELEEKNKKNLIEIICYQEELENSIPVSLVEEKIEELKNEDLEIYDTDSEDLIIAKYEQRAILNFLQELLEKRK